MRDLGGGIDKNTGVVYMAVEVIAQPDIASLSNCTLKYRGLKYSKKKQGLIPLTLRGKEGWRRRSAAVRIVVSERAGGRGRGAATAAAC